MSARIPAGGPFKAAAGIHEPLTLEHIREAKRFLSAYCTAGGDVCEKALALAREAAERIARVRLFDLAFEEKYQGLDAPLFTLVRRLLEVYASYIGGLAATAGESLVLRVVERCYADGALHEPGDLVAAPPSRGFKLAACGAADVVEALVPALARVSRELKGS